MLKMHSHISLLEMTTLLYFGKSLWAAGDLYNYTGPLPDKLKPHHNMQKLSQNLKVFNESCCLVGQPIPQWYLADRLVEGTFMVIAPNQKITNERAHSGHTQVAAVPLLSYILQN
jgi:hypothetical protein